MIDISVCCFSHLWVHLDLSPFSAPTTCVGLGSWEIDRERVSAPCDWRWCDDMSAYMTVVGGEVRDALEAARSSSLLCDTCQTWNNCSSEEQTGYSQWRHSQCHLPVFYLDLGLLSVQPLRKITFYKTTHIVTLHSDLTFTMWFRVADLIYTIMWGR